MSLIIRATSLRQAQGPPRLPSDWESDRQRVTDSGNAVLLCKIPLNPLLKKGGGGILSDAAVTIPPVPFHFPDEPV